MTVRVERVVISRVLDVERFSVRVANGGAEREVCSTDQAEDAEVVAEALRLSISLTRVVRRVPALAPVHPSAVVKLLPPVPEV